MVDLSRFRRRREQANPRFYDKPSRERHFFSIIGSVLSVVLMVVALALREWAKAGNEFCDFSFGLIKIYVTIKTTDQPAQQVFSSECAFWRELAKFQAVSDRHGLHWTLVYTQLCIVHCVIS